MNRFVSDPASVYLPAIPRLRHVTFTDMTRSRGRGFNYQTAMTAQPVRPDANAQMAEEELFLRWLFRETGLTFAAYRMQSLLRRLPSCLRALRVSSLVEARRRLEHNPSQRAHALSALIIGVTGFFRDAEVFGALEAQVLASFAGRHVRCWSAGCSDGHELYSVAMLLDEMQMLAAAELRGTDCRTDAVRRARLGRFDDYALRDIVGTPRQSRFARVDGAEWAIEPKLRTSIDWRVGDLLSAVEPGAWDLILCRNLAIYLSRSACHELWQQLQRALRPGGYLVLGRAERPTGAGWLSPVSPCIYQRDRG